MIKDCHDHGLKGDKSGYANAQLCPKSRIKTALHRIEYALANGLTAKDIVGMHVMHTCDNPRCINPDHLKLGTHADNMRDKVLKGRSGLKVPEWGITWILENYVKSSRTRGAAALARILHRNTNWVKLVVKQQGRPKECIKSPTGGAV